MRPGDWICPNPLCGDLVFASRGACFKCRTPKPPFGAVILPPGGGAAVVAPAGVE